MKIYVLQKNVGDYYKFLEVEGLYSSYEKAETAKRLLKRINGGEYEIKSMMVDDEVDND